MLANLPLLPGMRRPHFTASGVGTNPTSANCKGWWALDDSSGTLVDAAGINSMDIIVGTPTYSVGGAKKGTAISVAATAYGRKTLSSATFATAFPVTVAGWVKTAASNTGVMFGFGVSAASNQFFWLRVTGNKLQVTARNTASASSNSTTTIADGTYHHVACVFASATERRLYVDAVADGGGSGLTSAPFASPTAITIGSGLVSGAASAPFTGTLDEWCAFDDALTADEITWLHNAGTGRTFSEL